MPQPQDERDWALFFFFSAKKNANSMATKHEHQVLREDSLQRSISVLRMDVFEFYFCLFAGVLLFFPVVFFIF